MAAFRSHSNGLILRSALPGRARWDMPALFRKPLLAEALQDALVGLPGFLRVRVASVTGRVLVYYDQTQLTLTQAGTVIADTFAGLGKNIVKTLLDRDTSAPGDGTVGPTTRIHQLLGRTFDADLVELIAAAEREAETTFYKPLANSTGHTALRVFNPLAIGLMMSVALSGGFPPLAALGLTSKYAQMAVFGGTFLLGKTLESVLEDRKSSSWNDYAVMVEQALRLKTFRHLHSLDMGTLSEHSSDQLMNFFHGDIAKIRGFLQYTPPTMWDKALNIIAGGTIMMVVSPIALLLALIPLPLLVQLSKKHQAEAGENFEKVAAEIEDLNRVLSANMGGMATVKSFAAEAREIASLQALAQQLRESESVAAHENSRFNALSTYTLTMGICMPLVYSCFALMSGSMSMVGFLIQTSMIPVVLTSATGLEQANYQYQDAKYAAKRLHALLALQAKIHDGHRALEARGIGGELVFENVTFGYDDTPVLRDISLTIPANQTYAVVGTTGSGKSTLIKLLQRFYDVDGGRITLDGVDLRELHLKNLREAVGLVSQDTYLFNATIYENVLYGRPDATREEVLAACEAAEMASFVAEEPLGYDTVIGERGQRLSGGQRQRISIARTILKNPPIFILDEATSAVDNKTEAAIQRSVNRIAANRTTIIIAHRLSSVIHADQINVLEEGRFVESGSHDALLARDGVYAHLWRLQTEARQLESEVG
ncbi:ABC transporter ATP-binding protein/permease [Acanthopleuribacter pedis]|uniref:ABC transporter ATP-binding protein n=1 Tax=Acanthopleuribacter pedis TaxID=442870 RepID=A0A8J7Q5R4_9BACT|nr:ABC transporter ATP-binding protein/permease [Acanthopleuribacter pedis]MBO1317335.1 ABC transporter ATP-binding protein [Acanthopleuribacter pedis]MBO1318642.1 ABC transporter ATP-binding protein [Acanthopleuribacter pedis]